MSRNRSKSQRTRLENAGFCYLCGLQVPELPVAKDHPLCVTRDHVLPRKMGGKSIAGNIAPAHHACNQAKSDIFPVPGWLVKKMRKLIVSHLQEYGIAVGKGDLSLAHIRTTQWRNLLPVYELSSRRREIERWENEGGAVGQCGRPLEA